MILFFVVVDISDDGAVTIVWLFGFVRISLFRYIFHGNIMELLALLTTYAFQNFV